MNDRRSDGGTLPAADCGLLLLRVGVAGLMLALHGWARFFRASDYVVFGTAWPFVVDDHRSGPVCLRRLATRRTAGNDVKGPFPAASI